MAASTIIGVIVPAGTADGGTSIETSDAGIIVAVTGVTAAPDQIALDQAGVLYLLDTVASRIERLSLSQRVLLPPLVGTLRAQTMAVAPDGTAAYLGYEGGRIDAFDLSTATATFCSRSTGDGLDDVGGGRGAVGPTLSRALQPTSRTTTVLDTLTASYLAQLPRVFSLLKGP